MSDSLRLYYTIFRHLDDLLPDERVTRVRNLAYWITGAVKSCSVHLPKIAEEVPLPIQISSIEQRFRRWLKNKTVNERAYYEPTARTILRAMAHGTIILLIDTTPLGLGCQASMVAIAYHKRAVPLAWYIQEGEHGHLDAQIHCELLTYVTNLIPKTANVIAVGDGEFGSIDVQAWAEMQGWGYALRVCQDTTFQAVNDTVWRTLRSQNPEPGGKTILRDVFLTQKEAFGPVNVIILWDEGENEPRPIVTNLSYLSLSEHSYRKRAWIETLFGDQKGHGFHLELSRLSDPERLSRLLLVLAIAYVWMLHLGTEVVHQGQRHLIDRTDRRELSLFRLGLGWLKRLLKLDQPIVFGFQLRFDLQLQTVRE